MLGRVRRRVVERLDQVVIAGRRTIRRRAAPLDELAPLDGVRFAMVIVNFSTTRFVKLLLATLSEQSQLDLLHSLVIVDNGSRDGGPAFLERMRRRVPRVSVVERRHRLSHAAGMRAGIRALDDADNGIDPQLRSNMVLFCDADVVFRSPDTLGDLAAVFGATRAALAGEMRRVHAYPDIQASFFAVRRDVYERPDIWPPVDHGSPAYWMQRSIQRAGLTVVDFPSNRGGHVLHRGRSGVAAARLFRPWHHYASVQSTTPHFMGVPDGERIWSEIEARHAPLLGPEGESDLLDLLADRFARGREPVVTHQSESLRSDATIAWHPGVFQRRSVGAVIVAGLTGDPITLTGTGPVVWSLFEQPTSPDEVVAELSDEFGAPAELVRAEVEQFVTDLLDRGILARVPGDRPRPEDTS